MTDTAPATGPQRSLAERTRGWRVALIALAGASLISGLNAALLRLGVWAPVVSDRVADLHGPVMVLGFMGTLISLERAQAMRNPLAYLAPALLGLGSLALLAGAPVALGKLLSFALLPGRKLGGDALGICFFSGKPRGPAISQIATIIAMPMNTPGTAPARNRRLTETEVMAP